MSFLPNPAKYFREALETRRERQHLEGQRRLEGQHQNRRRPYFGARRNLHDHRHIEGTGPEVRNQENESLPEIPKQRSMSKMFDSVFKPEDYSDFDIKPVKSSIMDCTNDSSVATSRSSVAIAENVDENKVLDGLDTVRKIPTTVILPFGSPENISTDPILFGEKRHCGPFKCNRFRVSKKLQTSFERQSQFLKRVMAFLACQVFFVIICILIVLNVSGLKELIVPYHNYSFISFGVFLIIKIAVRTASIKIRTLCRLGLVYLQVLTTLLISYYCAAETAYSKSHVILLTAIVVFLTEAFFTVASNFVEYDVTSPEIIGMAVVVNAVFSIAVLIIYVLLVFEGTNDFFEIIVKNWIPSFFASEIIIAVLLFDIKQVMKGWRYPLGEADWVYTVLYV